jgi:sugar phosphate isomerase/epimerase
MKLSFWTLGTAGWSNADVVEAAKRFGFQGVDLRCTNGGNITPAATTYEIDDLRRLFEDAGVEIASLLAYNQRGGDDGVDWDAVRADLIANADVAARLGAPAMRINVGRPAAGISWDAYFGEWVEALNATFSAAPAVKLLVQHHPGSITAAQAGELAAMVNHDRFGIGLSPDHCVDMNEDTVAVVEQIAPWVRQVYLADRERLAGGKLKACLPGDGFVPNRDVLDVLRRNGFDGYVSFKWERPTYPDLPAIEVALPHFVSFMTKVAG